MVETSAIASNGDQKLSPVDSKISADLDLVVEKMQLLRSMLRPGDGSPTPSLKTHDTMLTVVGFLEACAPRLVELVEAASMGALGPSILEKCLNTNDQLTNLLADIETIALTETDASTTVAAAPQMTMSAFEDDDDGSDFFNQPAASAMKSTGYDFPVMGEDAKKPAAVAPSLMSFDIGDIGSTESKHEVESVTNEGNNTAGGV